MSPRTRYNLALWAFPVVSVGVVVLIAGLSGVHWLVVLIFPVSFALMWALGKIRCRQCGWPVGKRLRPGLYKDRFIALARCEKCGDRLDT
ncbi:MAG TPA: hypothetical protein VGB55_12725 [Tepidisphaeraceae bacterium]|jgi:hypothetical protein